MWFGVTHIGMYIMSYRHNLVPSSSIFFNILMYIEKIGKPWDEATTSYYHCMCAGKSASLSTYQCVSHQTTSMYVMHVIKINQAPSLLLAHVKFEKEPGDEVTSSLFSFLVPPPPSSPLPPPVIQVCFSFITNRNI